MTKIHDTINLLRHSSPAKISNHLHLIRSYYFSKWSKKANIKGLPSSISIEPTTSCNLRCPECPSGLRSFTRPTGMLQQELFRAIIDELHPTLHYLNFYFQGEPYLNPAFLDLVHYAASKKIYTATSTNAHYLNEENAIKTVRSGLARLIISIDGTTQESYQSYRIGGELKKVIEGSQNIIKWKKKLRSKTPHTIFQFLVVGPNEHQIDQIKQLKKEIGIDELKLKTAQIYDFKNGSPLIPQQSKYARYRKQDDGTYAIKNKLYRHCWKMWHSCVITWDGKVVPCCFDKDAHFVLGDLNNNSFKEIWNDKPYQAFREKILQARSQIEICKNCSEGTHIFA